MSIKVLDPRKFNYVPATQNLPYFEGIKGWENVYEAIVTDVNDCESLGLTAEKILRPGAPLTVEYPYDEIFYALDGPLYYTCNGKKGVVNVGDLCLITKGTTVVWDIPNSATGYSVTHPPLDVVLKEEGMELKKT